MCEKGHFMNTLEKFEIYKATKIILITSYDKLNFTTNTLYDVAIHSEFDLNINKTFKVEIKPF